MRNLWREFKAFAISGNVLDLALGFLIGAAFAKLVESLASNVLMQFVAAIFAKPKFSELTFPINDATIQYGLFLTDLVDFAILAVVMFLVIKFISRIGIVRARTYGDDGQCPYCLETVPPKALTCRACGQQLVEELPSPEEARRRLVEQSGRRGFALPQIPIPGRRREQRPEDESRA